MGVLPEHQPLYPQPLPPHQIRRRRNFRILTLCSIFILSYLTFNHISLWTNFRGRPSRCHRWSHSFDNKINSIFEEEDSFGSSMESRHFSFPLDTPGLEFTAHHANVYGNFRVESLDDDSDKIHVNLSIHYRTPDAKDWLEVESIRRDSGVRGVKIKTDIPEERRHCHDSAIRVDITVSIPSSVGNLKTLNTNLPVFHQAVEKLPNVLFDTVFLRSVSGALNARDLIAKNMELHSENGRISGTFNSSRTLFLQTSNGAIDVTLYLLNDEEQTTTARLITSNGAIHSNISLISSKEDKTGGAYSLEATTSNGAVHIAFHDAPVLSNLQAIVATTMGSNSVSLHPTFEGTFVASTTLGATNLVRHPATDPSGRNRERHVHANRRSSNLIKGSVYWDSSRDEVCRLSVSTTVGAATIAL